jgi:predicted nucleic acid-binding protein
LIVLDASVLANVLADDGEDGRRARDRIGQESDLAAPDLADVETVAVLRKRWLAGDLTERRFASAVDDLEDLDLDRYPALSLMRRAYELRANVSAYDASYIALAEGLACTLLTTDERLARAPGSRCHVEALEKGT